LAVALGTHAIQAAPVGLIATLSTTAMSATFTATTIATQTTMHWFNTKTIAAALTASTGTYLLKQREASRLQNKNQNLLAQQASLTSHRDAALATATTHNHELERWHKERNELLRLRAEVSQMRQQLEALKSRANGQTAQRMESPRIAGHAPGSYISKEQMAFAGYATPEAALETCMWAGIKGTYEQVLEGLSPNRRAHLSNFEYKESFEVSQKQGSDLLKGMQIVAKKVLGDNEVELKCKMDVIRAPGLVNPNFPEFLVQSMSKVGDEWKMGDSGECPKTWDEDLRVTKFIP
jgi:hypothetical protein